MRIMTVVLCAILTIALALTPSAGEGAEPSLESPTEAPVAEVNPDIPNPMLGFSRLVGGSWKIGPLRHVFEWGVGNRSLIGRTYDGEGKLSAEARWFWHPGKKRSRATPSMQAVPSSPR